MGIGRSTVLQLVAEGAHVVSCARRKPKLDELTAAVLGLSGSFEGYELDVGDTEAFARLVNDTAEKHGRLDVLVNNAPSVIGGLVVEQSLKDWRANFGVGVDSVFVGVQAAMSCAASTPRWGRPLTSITSLWRQNRSMASATKPWLQARRARSICASRPPPPASASFRMRR